MKLVLSIPALALSAATSFAAAFTTGNLVVVQDGTGAAALNGNATAAFLNEYTVSGSSVQALPLPTTASGANGALTLSGTATSEGFLTLSANGQYLTLAGYNQAVGTASITASTGNRSVARIDLNGIIDTTTILNDSGSIGNVRSVVSDNGSGIWVASSSGGIRYTPFGSTAASTQISTAPVNTRVVNIYGNQLYLSSASAPYVGVATVGSGLPTTSGQTVTLLSGFPTVAGPSTYDYVFADVNTIYVADDRATASGGGLQKWSFNGSSWALSYTLTAGLTAGLRGLTGVSDGSGNFLLYATTADGTSGNKLVATSDLLSATTLPGAETFATLATAAPNTAFRGVELIPAAVPEPTCAVLGLLGFVTICGYRRQAR
jgi:hypothetical protein